jgi:hypothetical protein
MDGWLNYDLSEEADSGKTSGKLKAGDELSKHLLRTCYTLGIVGRERAYPRDLIESQETFVHTFDIASSLLKVMFQKTERPSFGKIS